LAQLGGALSLVCPPALLEAELERFSHGYQTGLRDGVFGRLNLAEGEWATDIEFLSDLFGWLTETRAGWDQFFHDWYCGGASADRAAQSPAAALYKHDDFAAVRDGLEKRTGSGNDEFLSHPYWARPEPVTMVIDEVEHLWALIAEKDDWSLFEAKLADVDSLKTALGASCHGPVA